jgi:hypothetical protein
MQDRRHRPGDVLDDYCPRERRITDHAIVAMIDDQIQKTRCGICDAEHDYKEGKVPTPRRKTQPPALFTQVLETMNGPVPAASLVAPSGAAASAVAPATAAAVVSEPEPVMMVAASEPVAPAAAADEPQADREISGQPEGTENDDEREGGFRRSLIRATFPRPDGQAPAPRANPEFTIQSLNNRRNNNGQRHAGGANTFRGGRRRPAAGGGSQDNLGPMRFRDHGSQQGGQGQGQGQGQGGGRRRRGGKKNR